MKMETKEEIMTFYGRCRCCLEYGYMKNLWKEHIWEEQREVYGEMLLETFYLTFETTSSDEHICETCIGRLRDAFHFKKLVISTEQLLEECFEEDNKDVKLKEDVTEDEELLEEGSEEDTIDAESKHDETEEALGSEMFENAENDYNNREDHEFVDVKEEYGDIEFLDEDAEFVEQSVKIEKDIDSDTAPKTKLQQNNKKESVLLDKGYDSDSAPKGKSPPVRKKGARTRYRNYTQADLKKCIEMIQTKGLSQTQAAKMFNIPMKTLNIKLSSLKGGDEESDSQEEVDKMEIKKHRDNIRTILKYTNATPIRGHQGIGYICYFCPKQFARANDLRKHTYQHKDISEKLQVRVMFSYSLKLDITRLKCKICSKSIDDFTLEQVMDHLKRHGKIIHHDIFNHIIPFKFDTDVLKCMLCPETFTYFKLLSAHMSEHYPNYPCKQCGKGFITKHARKAHAYRHVTGEFQCSKCEKMFATRLRMTNHERVVHVLHNKTQKCGYCEKRFVDVVQKSNHEVFDHGAEPPRFICEYCNKLFVSQRALTGHVKRCHLMLRPHKCELCEKAFYKKSALKKHYTSHTGERNYQCDLCKKFFSSRSSVQAHLKIHYCR